MTLEPIDSEHTIDKAGDVPLKCAISSGCISLVFYTDYGFGWLFSWQCFGDFGLRVLRNYVIGID